MISANPNSITASVRSCISLAEIRGTDVLHPREKFMDGYLVLARKEQEKIIITTSDGQIEVMVAEIGNDKLKAGIKKVRLAIKAPTNVRINREEIERAYK